MRGGMSKPDMLYYKRLQNRSNSSLLLYSDYAEVEHTKTHTWHVIVGLL